MNRTTLPQIENIRDFNVKMIEMARANTEAVFEFARQLATAKTPSEIMELWTSHARKQFEMLSGQTQELTALGQKLTGESAGPSPAASTRHSEKLPDDRRSQSPQRRWGASLLARGWTKPPTQPRSFLKRDVNFYRVRRVGAMRNSMLAYVGSFICRHCGAEYLVRYTELSIADSGSVYCDVCRRQIIQWNS